MNPSSIDLINDVQSFSEDENDVSFSSVSSVSSSCTTSSGSLYSNTKLQQLLQADKEKYRVLPNESTKALPSWWRLFGFPAIKNEKNEFERIQGYISCKKCYRTSVYGSKSGTKRFIDHVNRCSPLSTPLTASSNGPQSTQTTLDKIVVTKKSSVTMKEQNEIKKLYAKWVCEDLRPYSIVEDNGFQELAQSFIRIGKNSC